MENVYKPHAPDVLSPYIKDKAICLLLPLASNNNTEKDMLIYLV
jgi:hypothetical protein